jgi:hypothetical protein
VQSINGGGLSFEFEPFDRRCGGIFSNRSNAGKSIDLKIFVIGVKCRAIYLKSMTKCGGLEANFVVSDPKLDPRKGWVISVRCDSVGVAKL